MKKTYYPLLLIGAAFIFSFSIIAHKVSATVGGPTYISALAFKAQDNAVYYTVDNYSGRGCPPIIRKLDLATLTESEVKSCDQYEQEFVLTGKGMQEYGQFIHDTYQELSSLWSVSIKKNNIDVQVEYLSEHREEGELFWNEFRATVVQDSKEVARIDFRGCAKDQPHVFEGYMIPNSDKMAILISNKGNCFEGGYVNETLHIMKGIKYYDNNIVRSYKDKSATEPNTGNMVVYAASDDPVNVAPTNNDAPTTQNDAPLPQKDTDSALRIALLAVIFVAGALIGYIIGKKSAHHTSS